MGASVSNQRTDLEGWLDTAETLLLQFVPAGHDGRNTWLLNMGVSEAAHHQRVEWNRRHGKDEHSRDRLDPNRALFRERLLAASAPAPFGYVMVELDALYALSERIRLLVAAGSADAKSLAADAALLLEARRG